jgi:hypothetical protein
LAPNIDEQLFFVWFLFGFSFFRSGTASNCRICRLLEVCTGGWAWASKPEPAENSENRPICCSPFHESVSALILG